jgi:hypothetical protein
MRFISEQRFNDEDLVWGAITEADLIIDPELFKHAYYKIVDADGVVYTGIIKEDGRVESGCGAVAVGRACLFPPLSSGGALVARP